MVSTCQACAGRATVSICPTCTSKLRDLLEHLPQWITHLEEAAIGQVRLGDGGGGRTTARREPFKGDDEVLPKCTCEHPESEHQRVGDRRECFAAVSEHVLCACWDYAPVANQSKLRAQFLAAGRINARAADLLDAVRNSLTTWTRHLGETRGIVFVRPGFIGPLLPGHVRLANTTPAIVAFLAEHVGAIACDESAGECLAELEDHVRAIEKVINRPTRRVWLGDCPTWHERTRRICGVSLWALEDAVEVRCQHCRGTHDPQRLKLLLFNDLERKKVPWTKILQANKSQPEDRRVNERTLQSWRRSGRLSIRGYLRPNGREVINRHSDEDEPLYLWPDVRKLRDAKPQKAPTGAAAWKRNPVCDKVI